MQIIPCSAAYAPQAVALILSIQNDENGLGLTLAEQPELRDIPVAFANGGFWVAVSAGRVVGTIGLLRVGQTGGILKKFFVDAAWRGCQVGLQLYQTALAHAEAAGLRVLVLDTPAIAVRAHSFYRRAGFVQIQPQELPFPYQYPDRDSLLFRKTL